MADMDEENKYDWLRSTSDISQEEHTLLHTLSQKVKAATCQITHGIRYVTSRDHLLTFISVHCPVTFMKYTYAILAATFQSVSSGNNNLPQFIVLDFFPST